jgi:c-di-GMP-binding flagellar brake protein YcgR
LGAILLPAVNSLVKIQFDGREYSSRVEDDTGGQLILAAPQGGTVETPRENETVTLIWSAGERGRYTAAINLISVERAQLSLWTVKLAGQPQIEQRRQFVRGRGTELVRLEPPASGDVTARQPPISGPVDGQMVDIGEGGIRISVADGELAAGQLAMVTVWLGQQQLGLDAVVYETIAEDAKRTMVVMRFQKPTEKEAQLIRQYVLRRQLAARNGLG